MFCIEFALQKSDSQTLIAKFRSPGWNEKFQEEFFKGVKSGQ